MPDPISAVSRLAAAGLDHSVASTSSTAGRTATSFGQLLSNALSDLNETALGSDKLAESFAAGEDVEIHEVMIAMQETELAFELATQVRNKAVEAYQEILRLQV